MDLHSTLQAYALQLKNTPRTLLVVAQVVQKIMKTLYDAHFPTAEDRRPGRSRFNRRDLSADSEVVRRALTAYIPKTDVCIADSFPNPYLRLQACEGINI